MDSWHVDKIWASLDKYFDLWSMGNVGILETWRNRIIHRPPALVGVCCEVQDFRLAIPGMIISPHRLMLPGHQLRVWMRREIVSDPCSFDALQGEATAWTVYHTPHLNNKLYPGDPSGVAFMWAAMCALPHELQCIACCHRWIFFFGETKSLHTSLHPVFQQREPHVSFIGWVFALKLGPFLWSLKRGYQTNHLGTLHSTSEKSCVWHL